MVANGYPLGLAASDLAEANLLRGVWQTVGGELLPVAPNAYATLTGDFEGASLDSRHLDQQQLFVALPGAKVDGRNYVQPALEAGHWVLAGMEAGGPGPDCYAGLSAPEGTGVLLCSVGDNALQVLATRHRQRWVGIMVGITGTNGKTTCKDLCAAMLRGAGSVCATKGNHNNRLGVPLTLLDLSADHDFAVVEMGASAVGEIAALAAMAQPQIGVITNAAPAHLAEFGSLAGIITGKGELLAALPGEGTAVLNADSPGFEQWCNRAPCKIVSWGRSTGEHRWQWGSNPGVGWTTTVDGQAYATPLPGRHNGANLTAALLASRAAGLGEEAISSGLTSFQGSDHRGQLFRWQERLVLDDSYNANPRSMVASCTALRDLGAGQRTLAVLGAMGELGSEAQELHRQTGLDLAKLGIQTLLAVGGEAKFLGLGFDEGGGEAHYCPSHAEAGHWLQENSAPGDVILLKGSRSSAMENVMAHLPGITPATQGQ